MSGCLTGIAGQGVGYLVLWEKKYGGQLVILMAGWRGLVCLSEYAKGCVVT